MRFLKNLGRNIRATALYFLLGVLLSALFQRYVPADRFAEIFGKSNEGFGVLMAATIGVPLYACGGIYGHRPSYEDYQSGALKIVLGLKRFVLYLAFVMVFSLVTGLVVNLVI